MFSTNLLSGIKISVFEYRLKLILVSLVPLWPILGQVDYDIS